MEREKSQSSLFLNWEAVSEARRDVQNQFSTGTSGEEVESEGRMNTNLGVSKSRISFWNTNGLRTGEKPRPSVGAHPIAQPADRSTCQETHQGTQRLLVCGVECRVTRCFPQPCECQSQLQTPRPPAIRDWEEARSGDGQTHLGRVSGLEGTPNEDGRECDDVPGLEKLRRRSHSPVSF